MSHVHGEVRLKGTPLAPGIAAGRTCFYMSDASDAAPLPNSDPQHEAFRLRQAFKRLRHQLDAMARDAEAKLGHEGTEIFHDQQLIMSDDAFEQQLFRAIEKSSYTAEKAVETELDLYKAQIRTADSRYPKQRVSSITEIQQALKNHLKYVVACRRCKDVIYCSVNHCCMGNDHIVVVGELTASLPLETDSHTVGFIVESVSKDSSAVALVRALGRPAVSDIRKPTSTIPLQEQIMINGDTGEVIINPSKETLARCC